MKKKPPVTFETIEQRPPPGLLATDEQRKQWITRCIAEDDAKLANLCEHFGIAPGPEQWYLLSLALARELYPAPKTKGRTKWTHLARGALTVEIERLVVEPGDPAHGAAWAAKELAKREPWRSFMAGNKEPAEALRKAYFSYRDDLWCKVARDAFKFNQAEGAIAEWDALVVDIVNNPE